MNIVTWFKTPKFDVAWFRPLNRTQCYNIRSLDQSKWVLNEFPDGSVVLTTQNIHSELIFQWVASYQEPKKCPFVNEQLHRGTFRRLACQTYLHIICCFPCFVSHPRFQSSEPTDWFSSLIETSQMVECGAYSSPCKGMFLWKTTSCWLCIGDLRVQCNGYLSALWAHAEAPVELYLLMNRS